MISPRLASGLWQGDCIKTAPSRAFCLSTKRGVRRKNRVSSFYGSHAMAKTFLEMLATLPQTPKHFPWDLRGSRKRQKVFRETCNGVASISKSSLAVAARYPRHPLWIGNPILSSNLRYGKEDHARGWDLHRSAKSLKAGAVLMQLPWRRLRL